MQFFMLNTAEWQSDRFLRLCEYLELDATEEDQVRVRGYFATFVCKWANDMQTDGGLFFDTPPRRLGIWARAPKPEVFGNALLKVGYVCHMQDKYPASVLKGRVGLVYWGALDITWRSVHCERMNARDLVLFRADPVKRSRAALQMGIRPEEFPGAPGEWPGSPEEYPGWILTKDRLSDAPPEAETRGASDGASAGWTGGRTGGDPPAPPLPPREDHVKERNIKQREHVGRTTQRRVRTGTPPSSAQYHRLRELKNEDIPAALNLLDAGERARKTWAAICEHDMPFAHQVISELVESEQSYREAKWPPGLVFARCEGRLEQLHVNATDYVVTGRATLERGGGGIGFGP